MVYYHDYFDFLLPWQNAQFQCYNITNKQTVLKKPSNIFWNFNWRNGENIRVCMGIFTTVLRNKKIQSNSHQMPRLTFKVHFMHCLFCDRQLAKMALLQQSKQSQNN